VNAYKTLVFKFHLRINDRQIKKNSLFCLSFWKIIFLFLCTLQINNSLNIMTIMRVWQPILDIRLILIFFLYWKNLYNKVYMIHERIISVFPSHFLFINLLTKTKISLTVCCGWMSNRGQEHLFLSFDTRRIFVCMTVFPWMQYVESRNKNKLQTGFCIWH